MPASSGETSNWMRRHVTAEFEDDVEPEGLVDLARHVDHLDLAPAEGQRPPGRGECFLEGEDEVVEVTAHQSIDVLGRASRRVQSMLEQRAALEEEQLSTLGVDGALDCGDRD